MSKKKIRGKKMRIIAHMLRRRRGCTSSEVKERLGWASVSIPQRARQLGIKTRKVQIGRGARYWEA